MIAVAITVVMGSVYLLSLQWVDDASTAQEEEVVQDMNAAEEGAPKEEAESKEGVPQHAESNSDGVAHGAAHDKGAQHGEAHEEKAHPKKESAEHGQSAEHGEHAQADAQKPSHAESSDQEGGVDLSKKYRPRIIGRCKVLYERFNKMELQANQFHAFAYSFDGKSGYCADSGPQTSAKLAKEIALSDCEKNKGSAESYAPCFIYSSDK